jgi:hypothetical protein
MVVITVSREMRAGVGKVWELFTDWEHEQEYWTNLRDIKVLTANDTTIEREATVGPRAFSQKTRQRISLGPNSSIKLSLSGDHIKGERSIRFVPSTENETMVDVVWNLELSDVPGFVKGIVKNQISSATEKALEKIAKDAERASKSKKQ